MNNNKDILVTIMLFLLVITGYQQFVVLPRARAAQKAAEAQLQEQQQAQEQKNLVASAQSAVVAQVLPEAVKPETFYTLDLPQADVTFSSKGAGIKTYLFKDVMGSVDLTPYKGEGFFATLPEVDFAEKSRTSSSITFEGDLSQQVRITKTFHFSENGINQVEMEFANNSEEDVLLPLWKWNFGPGLATVKSEMSDNERESKAVYLVQEPGKKKPTLETMTAKSAQPALPWMWAGVENRYFLSVLIPQGWQGSKLEVNSYNIGKQKKLWGLLGEKDLTGPRMQIAVAGVPVKAGEKQVYKADFYFGPKDYKAFLNLPYHLDRSIAFGFFGALGKIARNVLETFYGWTGNYGVAIIMITVLLQLILLKFTLMQFKSSAQMRKIQPEIKRLQEKYKGNQQALTQATFELYRKYKVNPLSGCLPLLIQLPIFLALFNALRTSWSLHGAKFIWWITDLSSKDPYYILPILMGAVMFFQQKGNLPPGTDPAQAAMFKYMPLIFTLMFMNFPSGLVLYWLTNSLLVFGIQTFVNKKMLKAN